MPHLTSSRVDTMSALSIVLGYALTDIGRIRDLEESFPGARELLLSECPELATVRLSEETRSLRGGPFLRAIKPWIREQIERFGESLLIWIEHPFGSCPGCKHYPH